MCLPVIGAAIAGSTVSAMGAAAASGVAMTAIGTGLAAVGTVFGIVQSNNAAKAQAASAYQQNDLAFRNQQNQGYFDRQQQVIRHIGDMNAQQASMRSYQNNVFNANKAANTVYVAEQMKFSEAKQKAAFKAVDIYAKQIGGMGKVLSSGAVGKSVGLLAMDPGRQGGRALAEQSASIRNASTAAELGMTAANDQQESSINQAYSRLPAPVQAPTFAPYPIGVGKNLGLGIPSYNFNSYG